MVMGPMNNPYQILSRILSTYLSKTDEYHKLLPMIIITNHFRTNCIMTAMITIKMNKIIKVIVINQVLKEEIKN